MTDLPIDPILPDVVRALRDHKRAVLQAPPGAGKTTRVPIALLDHIDGKIVMLEPRRIAARAAAQRLAAQLSDHPKDTVGYRMRGDSRPGTRIEVVTEGILTRMIQTDPELTGIGAVIFDEFHERSLNADLGLALVMEIRAALRPDLAVLVMSATLDAGPVAALLDDAPLLTSDGRSHPVEIRHLPRPLPPRSRIAPDVVDHICDLLPQTQGGMLVFLPGEGEIRAVQTGLRGRVSADVQVKPLFGSMPFAAQQDAIAPATSGRKIVLSTSIAETSLTIEDIRVVVDAGLARRARFDPNSGMSRLVTEKVTRAEATQRAGRAGRVAAGLCSRLWTKPEEGALPAYPAPEIEIADLTGLALELAMWGAQALPFLTPPPDGTLSEARALLRQMGALDDAHRITAHGKAMAALPVHPRLAHMLITAGGAAAPLAALLSDRDPMRGAGCDQTLRLTALRTGGSPAQAPAIKRINAEAKRLARLAPQDTGGPDDPGVWAALAYPDRIGMRRAGADPRWLLSGGRGATMDGIDALAGERILVATDLDGGGREARIRAAIPLREAALRAHFSDQITHDTTCAWSRRDKRVIATQREMLGAIALSTRKWDAPPDQMARAMLDGVRQLGLSLPPAAQRFCKRVALLRAGGADVPDMSDAALLQTAEAWLLPYLDGVATAAAWAQFDPLPALRAILTWEQTQQLDSVAPPQFTTPLGRSVPIDYDGDTPTIEIRLQELFGVTRHPVVGTTPIKIVLLSPARRPVQVTTDLPGFWRSSYADVRKDMRGRYSKHPWPEDPTEADPTLRTKRR